MSSWTPERWVKEFGDQYEDYPTPKNQEEAEMEIITRDFSPCVLVQQDGLGTSQEMRNALFCQALDQDEKCECKDCVVTHALVRPGTKIGKGAYGTVTKFKLKGNAGEVAIKRNIIQDKGIAARDQTHEAFVGHVLTEWTLKSKVPNFVQTFGIICDKVNQDVVIELVVSGVDFLTNYNIKSVAEIASINAQILLALAMANEEVGFVHFDTQAQNIILENKPLDFTYVVNGNSYRVISPMTVRIIDYGISSINYKGYRFGPREQYFNYWYQFNEPLMDLVRLFSTLVMDHDYWNSHNEEQKRNGAETHKLPLLTEVSISQWKNALEQVLSKKTIENIIAFTHPKMQKSGEEIIEHWNITQELYLARTNIPPDIDVTRKIVATFNVRPMEYVDSGIILTNNLDFIRTTGVEGDMQLCGEILATDDSEYMTMKTRFSSEQNCEHSPDCSQLTPFIFHTHGLECHPFPSVSDFVTVFNNNVTRSMLVIGIWGVFRIQRILHLSGSKVEDAITEFVNDAISLTMIDHIYSMEELTTIESLSKPTVFDQLKVIIQNIDFSLGKFGMGFNFTSWSDIENEPIFPLISAGTGMEFVPFKQISRLQQDLDKDYEVCGALMAVEDRNYVSDDALTIDNRSYVTGSKIVDCDRFIQCNTSNTRKFVFHTHPNMCPTILSFQDILSVYINQMIDTSTIITKLGIFILRSFKPLQAVRVSNMSLETDTMNIIGYIAKLTQNRSIKDLKTQLQSTHVTDFENLLVAIEDLNYMLKNYFLNIEFILWDDVSKPILQISLSTLQNLMKYGSSGQVKKERIKIKQEKEQASVNKQNLKVATKKKSINAEIAAKQKVKDAEVATEQKLKDAKIAAAVAQDEFNRERERQDIADEAADLAESEIHNALLVQEEAQRKVIEIEIKEKENALREQKKAEVNALALQLIDDRRRAAEEAKTAALGLRIAKTNAGKKKRLLQSLQRQTALKLKAQITANAEVKRLEAELEEGSRLSPQIEHGWTTIQGPLGLIVQAIFTELTDIKSRSALSQALEAYPQLIVDDFLRQSEYIVSPSIRNGIAPFMLDGNVVPLSQLVRDRGIYSVDIGYLSSLSSIFESQNIRVIILNLGDMKSAKFVGSKDSDDVQVVVLNRKGWGKWQIVLREEAFMYHLTFKVNATKLDPPSLKPAWSRPSISLAESKDIRTMYESKTTRNNLSIQDLLWKTPKTPDDVNNAINSGFPTTLHDNEWMQTNLHIYLAILANILTPLGVIISGYGIVNINPHPEITEFSSESMLVLSKSLQLVLPDSDLTRQVQKYIYRNVENGDVIVARTNIRLTTRKPSGRSVYADRFAKIGISSDSPPVALVVAFISMVVIPFMRTWPKLYYQEQFDDVSLSFNTSLATSNPLFRKPEHMEDRWVSTLGFKDHAGAAVVVNNAGKYVELYTHTRGMMIQAYLKYIAHQAFPTFEIIQIETDSPWELGAKLARNLQATAPETASRIAAIKADKQLTKEIKKTIELWQHVADDLVERK